MKNGLEPIYDKNSKILILGSLPSEQSIKKQEYYGNPTNQFWKILSAVFEDKILTFNDYNEKKNFLKKHHIALWDVIKCAQRKGSLDVNIKNETYNDLKTFVTKCEIKHIFVNGNKAKTALEKYLKENNISNVKFSYLTSSSSANAKYSLEDKINMWKIISGL